MISQDAALLATEGAWTNLAQTARLLGVDRSTLSKQAHAGRVRCVKVGLGRGQLVVPPTEVLRLAHIYRRVPMEEVQKKLAHEVAVQTSSNEEAVRRALKQLLVSDTGALVPLRHWEGREFTVVLPTKGEWAIGQPTAKTVDPIITAPVINLGRLRPRRMKEEDVPSAGLLEAIDLRRPKRPSVQIVDSNPPVIDLGRLRPGRRP